MAAVKQVHVGVIREYPPISPLSLWERARVRGFSVDKQIRHQRRVAFSIKPVLLKLAADAHPNTRVDALP